MTLIATFEIKNTPMLIGDLMLSQLGVEREHAKLPTYDDASKILPIDWQRNISGVHRKVCIVHPKVVIAWTGRLIYASHFVYQLMKLFDRNRNQQIDEAIFSDALSQCKESLKNYASRNEIGPDELTVIGWIITQDRRALQFEWTWYSTEYYENQTILARGSGADDLLEILEERISFGNPNENESLTSVAIESVSVVSMLLGAEVSIGSNIPLLYGGGYDIILLIDDTFMFLNEILYIPIFIFDLEQLYARVHNPTVFFKYFYVEGNLAIARKILELDQNGIVQKDEVTISVIGEFGADRKKLQKLEIESHYKFESSIVAMIFLSQLENGHTVYAPLVVTGKSDFIKFHEKYFAINKKVFKIIFPALKRMLNNEYNPH